MTGITLKNVRKVYPGGIEAVKDFNLEIEDKEFMVLVGPSGCGKSTVLRLIAGLESITSGELYFNDRLMNSVEPKDRDIAMVFQNYALYPHMSVYENMAFGLKLRRMNRKVIDDKVVNAARILGLTDYLDRKPKNLSGGQRQRVALGRAIVREPRVFLLDEPLSNLDAKMRDQMRTEINMLHKDLETTFVYVTHDQVEAMTMGTQIVVMKDGYIQQIDDAYHLYEYPVNRFVAGFIGTPQMNFIDVIITARENAAVLRFGDYRVRLSPGFTDRIMTGDYLDRHFTMGLRPEDIKTDQDYISSNPGQSFRARLNVVEELGNETLLFLAIPGVIDQLIVRTTERKLWVLGDMVDLAIDANRIKLFDRESEKNILKRDATGDRGRLS